MRLVREGVLATVIRLSRSVAAALIAGVWRRRSDIQIEARLRAMPAGRQAAVIVAVLALLAVASVVAGQFGWIGLLVLLLVVVLLVN